MHTNRLIHCTSPYLLQHSHNPVDWYPWSDEAWRMAREQNKLVLVSIGYSACHWCHVMEREVFENGEAALLMNDRFICIKVDREERPDVDQVYMSAVQLMNGQGGWPLNVFCLPDGRPVYGGTYFPLSGWMHVLRKLLELQRETPSRLPEYADQLAEGVRLSDMPETGPGGALEMSWIRDHVERWKAYWDWEKGGAKKAPKFPMPGSLVFLLHYGHATGDEEALRFVRRTLDCMARGGIYDQVGGGFARYSVDDQWKVPHFEKMLYDNAQLLTLYSQAYRYFGNEEYLRVVRETLEWMEREMKTPEGMYYAAVDADSEGEEGLYYTWTREQMEDALGKDAPLACRYYRVGEEGYWEHGRNVLLRMGDDESFAAREGMEPGDWLDHRAAMRRKLGHARSQRPAPSRDHKVLTSWNALAVTALIEAWRALGDQALLERAVQTASALSRFVITEQGVCRQYTSGVQGGPGFLDDYAFLVEAWLQLYEATGSERWLEEAHRLALHTLDHFADDGSPLLWYTPDDGESLFVRPRELADNVIPSANSAFARALFLLGRILDRADYVERSVSMIRAVRPSIRFAGGWFNWLRAALWHASPFHEVVVAGPDAWAIREEWRGEFRPDVLFAASTTDRSLPLFRSRFRADTPVYVCTGHTCRAPVHQWSDVRLLLSPAG